MPTIYVNNIPHQPVKEKEFYPTPIELCRAALNILPKDFNPIAIFDPGCGTGVWGTSTKEKYPDSYIGGIDIRKIEFNLAYSYLIMETDYLSTFLLKDKEYDLILGNPPYSLQEEFIDRSLELLKNGGYLLFLLKLSFLESKLRYNKYFNNGLNPKEVYVSVRRVSFTNDRKSNADAYGLFLWQKGWKGDTTLKWLNWNYD